MADNVQITAGSGTSIATDDISSVHYQRIKVILGGDGTNSGDMASNTGVVGATVPRVTIATDDVVSSNLVTLGGIVSSSRAAVNLIVGQAGIAAGAGSVGATVPRLTLASDDPAVTSLQLIDNIINNQNRGWVQVAQDVITISGNVALVPFYQPVNTSTNGAILVSGQANRKIRVLNGVLMATSQVTVNLKNNNNDDITGPLFLGPTGGFQVPHAEVGNFETAIGKNLTIAMNSGVQVGGWLTYVLV